MPRVLRLPSGHVGGVQVAVVRGQLSFRPKHNKLLLHARILHARVVSLIKVRLCTATTTAVASRQMSEDRQVQQTVWAVQTASSFLHQKFDHAGGSLAGGSQAQLRVYGGLCGSRHTIRLQHLNKRIESTAATCSWLTLSCQPIGWGISLSLDRCSRFFMARFDTQNILWRDIQSK